MYDFLGSGQANTSDRHKGFQKFFISVKGDRQTMPSESEVSKVLASIPLLLALSLLLHNRFQPLTLFQLNALLASFARFALLVTPSLSLVTEKEIRKKIKVK